MSLGVKQVRNHHNRCKALSRTRRRIDDPTSWFWRRIPTWHSKNTTTLRFFSSIDDRMLSAQNHYGRGRFHLITPSDRRVSPFLGFQLTKAFVDDTSWPLADVANALLSSNFYCRKFKRHKHSQKEQFWCWLKKNKNKKSTRWDTWRSTHLSWC